MTTKSYYIVFRVTTTSPRLILMLKISVWHHWRKIWCICQPLYQHLCSHI